MKITALIAVLLLAASARAIELSLEENRGERGSVGYVDMQRLFQNSPDSQRAKEGFEELVRQAEERVNLRKAELLKLRQQLDATRVERDALAHSMSLAPVPSTSAAPAAALVPAVTPPAPAPAATPAPAAAPAHAASTAAAVTPPAAPAGPALSPAAQALIAASTAPAAPNAHARELALPGMAATEPEPISPPAAKPGVPSSDGAAAVPKAPAAAPTPAPAAPAPAPAAPAPKPGVPSSDGAAAVPAVSSGAVQSAAGMFPAPPPAAPVAQAPAGPTPAQRLLELDAKIISLQADIAHKESELTQEHDEADKGLLDVESRKTDRVLAALYRAVSEVARREGVSVVIDKTTILYGHPAVDLTDKVLKYLDEKSKETPAP